MKIDENVGRLDDVAGIRTRQIVHLVVRRRQETKKKHNNFVPQNKRVMLASSEFPFFFSTG